MKRQSNHIGKAGRNAGWWGWLVAVGLVAGPALAEAQRAGGPASVPIVQPLTLQDMRGDGKLEASLPLLPSSGYFGMAPRLSLYGGTGTMSYGLVVPMALLAPDGADSKFIMGNLTADIKGRACRRAGGKVDFCVGGAMAIGTGFIDYDDPMAILAAIMASYGSQDFAYYAIKNISLRPLLVATATTGGIFFQTELGTAIWVPIIDTAAQSVEATMVWAFALGYNIMDMLAPMVEFRGFNGVSNGLKGTDAYFVNVGARMTVGALMPMLRIGVPLNSQAQIGSTNDIQVEVGVAMHF